MSCSAKVPIYAFFSAAFFPKHAALVMIGLYFTGIVIGIIMALIFKKTLFKESLYLLLWNFLTTECQVPRMLCSYSGRRQRTFTEGIFYYIYCNNSYMVLQNFDIRLNVVTDSKDSILAAIASLISPIFRPLGFGDWRIATAVLTGVMAKESVVSTISILFKHSRNTGSSNTSRSYGIPCILLVVYTMYSSNCIY